MTGLARGSGVTAPAALALLLLIAPAAAAADLALPPGFTAHVYVTGEGFEGAGGPGFPAVSTMGFDHAGFLYLARPGRRYIGGEVDDLWPLYRIPLGGARLTPETEARYFHGPPLPNPQVATVRAGHEMFVTTFDRDRKIGVLYRVVDGRAELFAGGTPPAGAAPLFRQPEGAAVDSAGNLYVADREQGLVVRLDPSGRVLAGRYAAVTRPRLLAIDAGDHLWIGADGEATTPWQGGPGEIWRAEPGAAPRLVLRGPVAASIALSPGGHLFVSERQPGHVFVLTAEGQRIEFARFADGSGVRSLGFAPDTTETRRGGIAGDLFVVVIRAGAWRANEVVRISGPFDDLASGR